jgi:hypothetical protein
VVEDQRRVQEEELSGNCMEQTLFYPKVMRSKVILAIGIGKGTWKISKEFGGRFLRKKGKEE